MPLPLLVAEQLLHRYLTIDVFVAYKPNSAHATSRMFGQKGVAPGHRGGPGIPQLESGLAGNARRCDPKA
ncbi:MAG: hypothetical protein IT368_10555 [Candidatus Hydrogenedentes bacterium]|nr:hypothetical protein [Candidatus Hydrogenedentota bacterium]